MITDEQIATLAEAWPWPRAEIADALRLADAHQLPLDDTVRGLDKVAELFGIEGQPLLCIQEMLATMGRR